jgi:hypothetical protein
MLGTATHPISAHRLSFLNQGRRRPRAGARVRQSVTLGQIACPGLNLLRAAATCA